MSQAIKNNIGISFNTNIFRSKKRRTTMKVLSEDDKAALEKAQEKKILEKVTAKLQGKTGHQALGLLLRTLKKDGDKKKIKGGLMGKIAHGIGQQL